MAERHPEDEPSIYDSLSERFRNPLATLLNQIAQSSANQPANTNRCVEFKKRDELSIALGHFYIRTPPVRCPQPHCNGSQINHSNENPTYSETKRSPMQKNTESRVTTYKWQGKYDCIDHPNIQYSRKVFIGGLCPRKPIEPLVSVLKEFGEVKIELSAKKGYAYAIFGSGTEVEKLLKKCQIDTAAGDTEYFLTFRRKPEITQVQIIPWITGDCVYCLQCPTKEQDREMKVFVGGLHGLITAFGLYGIMNGLFHNVIEVCIDTDKNKYPIGSARVTFGVKESYELAVAIEFINAVTAKFDKMLQIEPYLINSPCFLCEQRPATTYCKSKSCLKYFCSKCWNKHVSSSPGGHSKVVKKSEGGEEAYRQLKQIQAKRLTTP